MRHPPDKATSKFKAGIGGALQSADDTKDDSSPGIVVGQVAPATQRGKSLIMAQNALAERS